MSSLLIAAEQYHTPVIDFLLKYDVAQLNWLVQCLTLDDNEVASSLHKI